MDDELWPRPGESPDPASGRSPEGFRGFVELRWTALVRFGYLLTGDWAAAEDLVQVALERTWRRWGQVRTDRPEIYVKAAMANHMRSRWRRASPEAVSFEMLPTAEIRGGDAGGMDYSTGHALREALWAE